MITYKIVYGETQRRESGFLADKWWGVVAYEDGVCKGGDAHWLRRNDAIAAMDAYERGRVRHGDWQGISNYLRGV